MASTFAKLVALPALALIASFSLGAPGAGAAPIIDSTAGPAIEAPAAGCNNVSVRRNRRSTTTVNCQTNSGIQNGGGSNSGNQGGVVNNGNGNGSVTVNGGISGSGNQVIGGGNNTQSVNNTTVNGNGNSVTNTTGVGNTVNSNNYTETNNNYSPFFWAW